MLIVLIFLLLAVLSFSRESKKTDVIIIIVFLSFVSLIFSHRSSDFIVYQDYFMKVEPLHKVLFGENHVFTADKSNYELGYKLLNSLFKMFTGHIEVLYFFCNIFILYVVSKLLIVNSSNFFKLFVPYFIFMLITVQAGIIRQMIAIAIFFYSIQFITNREFWKFMLCALVAFSFHRTAVILPVFYLIATYEYSNKALIIIFLVGILTFIGIIPFHPLVIVENITSHITHETIHEKLVVYIDRVRNLPATPKFNRGIFENSLIFLLLIFIRNELKQKQLYDRFINICFNLALIYIFVYIFFFDINSISYRLNYYLIIFKFFVLVKYIESLDLNINRIIANSVLLIYCALMMIIRISQGY